MIKDIQANARDRMQKAIESLRKDLQAIRTGRASAALVDHIRIDYYGTPTPINQLGTVTVPESRLIVIQPWERNLLGAIEKAIQKSDLGLNPNNDGNVIRLALPQLNEQRRQELAKQVRKRAEEAKVAVRNIRREADAGLKRLEKDGRLSQDELRRATDRVQKLTDQSIKQVDEAADRKEREVKEV